MLAAEAGRESVEPRNTAWLGGCLPLEWVGLRLMAEIFPGNDRGELSGRIVVPEGQVRIVDGISWSTATSSCVEVATRVTGGIEEIDCDAAVAALAIPEPEDDDDWDDFGSIYAAKPLATVS